MLKTTQKAFQSINGICDDGRCILSWRKEVSFACNRAWMFSISLLIIHTTIKMSTLWNQSEMCKMKHTYIRTSRTQLYFWDQIQTCYIRLIMYYLQMNKKSTARNVGLVRYCCEQKHRMIFCILYLIVYTSIDEEDERSS